ncbi:DMT family transporter [Pseudogemmobacter humi]|uniref:Riboflavin transporter n=1 Tax=Pseudogemmobacter humi TaxID=2483812 RepID=A0A3P5X5S7_9RHOB|nr:DMT family transporter [Pseudogemmobacter humi]VDC23569.1 Riboflavin transporter [Pseudogemmobacter humi]
MTRPSNPALTGILLAAGGMALFSVNDMAIKHLSAGYALHQIVLIRAMIGLCFLLVLITRSQGGFAQLRTRRPFGHMTRVLVILTSNSVYFTGLAAMPLADAAAVSYTSPLFVTALSVVALRERVGARRWTAVALGLSGTVLILRPGAGVIQGAALLVLLAALLYAIGNLMTRMMRETETALSFSFFTMAGFMLISVIMGLVAGDGRFANDDPLWAFLFRPWIWPPAADWPWFLLTGLSVSIAGLMVAQAYRTTEAALIAPFDYAGMPMAIFWGVVIFGTWPDLTSWAGIALICGSGIYVVWREAVLARKRH